MHRPMIRGAAAALMLAAAFAAVPGAAHAQAYPSKPVRVILPFPPGGALDGFFRALAQPVNESFGQLVIENRPGASGIIGADACAKAAPDGYTLCTLTSDSLTYNPVLFRKLPYDADADFAPITNFVSINTLLIGSAKAPMNNFKEMISYAKANPGKLNWATWGTGTIPEVYLLWVKHQWGVNITAVPYKGAGNAVPAMLSGESDVSFITVGFAVAQAKSGKVKPIAIVGNKRSPAFPNVTTLTEEGGDPGLDEWYGILAPAKTPTAVINRVNAEFVKALKLPKSQELMSAQTLDPVGNSPAEFGAFLRTNRQNAAKLFQTLGIQPTDAPGS